MWTHSEHSKSAALGQAFLVLLALLASTRGRAEVPDAEVPGILAALEGAHATTARAAIKRVEEAEDRRFAAVFIELLRASEIGVASPEVGRHAVDALERLSGESFGADWPRWMRWYAGTDLRAPQGFTSFKGRLLGRIDPAFAELLRDELPSRIRVAEVVWGGVAFEGIPALDRAPVLSAAEASYLGPDEPVFGIFLGGEARAYPLRILDWHEMANDVVGGVPFSLAYCTLCGSGIAYDARIPGHQPFDFGSSGFLMRSNKLMVDRQTRTLWNQFTGRPVLGPLADQDIRLAKLPSVVTRWKDWRARHPETTVLSLDTGHRRPYQPGAAYAGYFASPKTMFPVRRVREDLPDKERVFGIERDGIAVAYPLSLLLERGVVNDRVAGNAVALVAQEPRIWVDGESVRSGPARYAAGAAVRAYARDTHEFHSGKHPGELADARGRLWRVDEDALVGPGGERLPRTAGVLAYWFGWRSYHPKTRVYADGPVAKNERGVRE
jgi:hypothetical protein